MRFWAREFGGRLDVKVGKQGNSLLMLLAFCRLSPLCMRYWLLRHLCIISSVERLYILMRMHAHCNVMIRTSSDVCLLPNHRNRDAEKSVPLSLRSQPPLLSAMVADVYNATKDMTFLAEAFPLLINEYDYWVSPPKGVMVRARWFSSPPWLEKHSTSVFPRPRV